MGNVAIELTDQRDCGGDTCYDVAVSCQGLTPREATIQARHIDDSKGAVILLGGGNGTNPAGRLVGDFTSEGYETYLLPYKGELGYGTGAIGAGLKDIMCSTTEMIKWIASDLADNPDAIGALGSSGGASQLGYGFSVYGLGDVLDVVVFDSGPIQTDLVEACLTFSVPGSSRGQIFDYAHDWFGKGDYCQNGEGPESIIPILQANSVVSSSPGEVREYVYSRAKTIFIQGEFDEGIVKVAKGFYDLITSEKEWIVMPGLNHFVVGQDEGAAKIIEKMLEGLSAQ